MTQREEGEEEGRKKEREGGRGKTQEEMRVLVDYVMHAAAKFIMRLQLIRSGIFSQLAIKNQSLSNPFL